MKEQYEFLRELKMLQEKYGVKIYSGGEEVITFTYAGEPKLHGFESYLVFKDTNGNEYKFRNKEFHKLMKRL